MQYFGEDHKDHEEHKVFNVIVDIFFVIFVRLVVINCSCHLGEIWRI